MGIDPDLDEVIAEVAAAHGLDAGTIPDAVVIVGVGLLHEAMPLLKRSEFDSHARWLPVLADAFVEWARREHGVGRGKVMDALLNPVDNREDAARAGVGVEPGGEASAVNPPRPQCPPLLRPPRIDGTPDNGKQ